MADPQYFYDKPDMLKLVLLGAPGSGKGTQSEMLVRAYGIPQISTGDLLRQAVADQTELGLQAKAAMDAGELVSDDVVVGMIRERLNEPDAAEGFILDGFPRSLAQAWALDDLLRDLDRPLDRVVQIHVEDEEIVKRLLARGRSDDTEETIRNRLNVFKEQTQPLADYYREQELFATVYGVGEVEAIYGRILQAIAGE